MPRVDKPGATRSDPQIICTCGIRFQPKFLSSGTGTILEKSGKAKETESSHWNGECPVCKQKWWLTADSPKEKT